jgi:hypothetical protein
MIYLLSGHGAGARSVLGLPAIGVVAGSLRYVEHFRVGISADAAMLHSTGS